MTHFSCASATLPNFFRGFPTWAAVNRPGKWNFKLISWPPYLQKYTLWGCNRSQSASKQAHRYHCIYIYIWVQSRNREVSADNFFFHISSFLGPSLKRSFSELRRSWELCPGYVSGLVGGKGGLGWIFENLTWISEFWSSNRNKLRLVTNHLLAGIYDKENRLHDTQTALGRREDQPSSVNP